MTIAQPPREATRRVSDEALADRIAHGDCDQGQELSLDLRDSRALVADLTRRLAESERREREAWCAGRDAAVLHCRLRDFGQREVHSPAQTADALADTIAHLNPPKPEGDRG